MDNENAAARPVAPTGERGMTQEEVENAHFARLRVDELHVERAGFLGRDPEARGMFGFFLMRKFGLMFKYVKGNYARIFIDQGNDSGQDTPSWIFDLPATDKMKLQDNLGNALVRVYGRSGKEVGGSETFEHYGAVDFFCPVRDFTWYSSMGNDPESEPSFSQEGFHYVRIVAGTSTLRYYLNGAWRTVTVT